MKQFRITMLLLIASVLLSANSCGEKGGHRYITITNAANAEVFYQFAYGNIMNIHQDTAFHCNQTLKGFLNKDSSLLFECPIRVDNWETELHNQHYFQVLIMDGERFKQNSSSPCDTIRKYVPILHAYRLTLEDLERMNWTVVYPPEE